MATSDTEIANFALGRLGDKQITSITDGTTLANICNLYYTNSRDALLRSHLWNFAIRRAALSQDTATPNHEYDYQYLLPTDCLRIIRTGWETEDHAVGTAIYGFPGLMGTSSTTIPYRVESADGGKRLLLCNEASVNIEYVAKITDVALFDPLFVEALALRLAMAMCMRITENATLYRGLQDEYRVLLTEARMTDATEGTPRDIVDTSGWLGARL